MESSTVQNPPCVQASSTSPVLPPSTGNTKADQAFQKSREEQAKAQQAQLRKESHISVWNTKTNKFTTRLGAKMQSIADSASEKRHRWLADRAQKKGDHLTRSTSQPASQGVQSNPARVTADAPQEVH